MDINEKSQNKALPKEVEVIKQAKDEEKVIFAQLAPAVRVSIGEEFGLPPGTELTCETVTLLKILGFDEVVDTPFGADLITYGEAVEFINNPSKKPLFNSCCVGWREFCKRMHPDIWLNVSSVISPMMATGLTIKTYVAEAMGKDPEDIIVVGIMPCTMKKLETKYKSKFGWRYVDYVITTRELGQWATKEGIDVGRVKKSEFSTYLPSSSKGGTIFGVTGGLSEAFISTVAELKGESVETKVFRQNKGMREIDVKLSNGTIHIGIAHGVANINNLIKEKDKFDFIEMMFCPYGCVGGPGQPLPQTDDVLKARAEALRKFSDTKKAKTSIDNPYVVKVIDFFKEKGYDIMEHLTYWGD